MAEHEKLKIYSFSASGLWNFKKKKAVFDILNKQKNNKTKKVVVIFFITRNSLDD